MSFLKERYRRKHVCHQVSSPKSYTVFGRLTQRHKGHVDISWGWPHQKRPGLYVCRWVQIQPLHYTGGHVLVHRCVGASGLLHRRNRWHSRSAHMVCSRHNGSVGGAWHAQQTMLHHYLALTSTPWSIWNQMELFTRGMYHPPIVGDQLGKALLNTWDALNLKRMKVCMQSMCGRLGSWWWQGETIPDINLRNSNSRSIATVSVITSLNLTLFCEINLDYFLYLSTKHFIKSKIFYAHISFTEFQHQVLNELSEQSHIWVFCYINYRYETTNGWKLRLICMLTQTLCVVVATIL